MFRDMRRFKQQIPEEEGHKLDAIAKCDKVSYCVMDQGYRNEGE